MLLFCSVCQTTYSSGSRCPKCGGLLLLPHEVSPDTVRRLPETAPLYQPTPFGRVVLGSVLALGLYIALQKVTFGMVMVMEPDPRIWWRSLQGLIAMHAVQVVSVTFGAMIAAAGQARGVTFGCIVGALCGSLFLAYELSAGAPAQDIVVYLQFPVLTAIGFVAGAIGVWVWAAPPKLDIPIMTGSSKLSSIRLQEAKETSRDKPTVWARVLGGAMIMILGATTADKISDAMQDYSFGLFRVSTIGQGEFIIWQIAAFAALFGAMVAGANTGAGLRHGFFAGVLGSAGVTGLWVKTGGALAAMQFWLHKFALEEHPFNAPQVLLCISASVLFMGMVGGWMGGALFLPLGSEQQRRRIRSGMD